VTVGASAKVPYPADYETVGVSDPAYNLRLQSPNSVFVHAGGAARLTVDRNGAFGYGDVFGIRGKCDHAGSDTDDRIYAGVYAEGHDIGMYCRGIFGLVSESAQPRGTAGSFTAVSRSPVTCS
jgi:hypothetical protein